MSNLETVEYVRRPFEVTAVQVTDNNLAEVADWCEGEVRETAEGTKFVKVKVYRPMNSRQTRAFVGDWVLYSGRAYKVYTVKAFEQSFMPKEV